MPGRDGTGPLGYGPMTGGGWCGGEGVFPSSSRRFPSASIASRRRQSVGQGLRPRHRGGMRVGAASAPRRPSVRSTYRGYRRDPRVLHRLRHVR